MSEDSKDVLPKSKNADYSYALTSYLFDRKSPLHLFDDIYHFSLRHYDRHSNNRNMLPVVKLMLTKIIERCREHNMPLMLVPEAITNGKLYYDTAEKHERRIREARNGHLVTYRMGEVLNKGELALLTEKNKNKALSRLEGFQKKFPEAMIISPTGMEAMLKTLMDEAGFSNRQMLRDEDFEAFWIGVCLISNMGGLADEVAHSRNGNFETFALHATRYGIIPFRPEGDTKLVFPNGKSATPYDYLATQFEQLVDVIPRGFTSDLTTKMAVRAIMLEDMRVNFYEHPQWGRLDQGKISPELKDLGHDHDKAFNELADEFIAFMHKYELGQHLGDLFGLEGYDNLPEYYEERLADLKNRIGEPKVDLNSLRQKLKSWWENHLPMESALRDNEEDLEAQIFPIPYQLDGSFFSKKAFLFDEEHYEQCDPSAQIALKAFMGLHETPKLPLLDPGKANGEIFVLTDRRGGAYAQDFANDNKVVNPAEARGLTNSFTEANFETVKDQTIRKNRRIARTLRKLNPKAIVSTSENIENDASNFLTNRDAIAETGAERFSSIEKTAYTEELLRRRGRLAVFDTNWENSSYLTFSRLQARKVQLGLVSRPVNMPKNNMTVADMKDDNQSKAKPYEVKGLYNDLKVMHDYMQRLVDNETEEYPRHVVKGMLELIIFADCYYNAEMNAIAGIDWQSVPGSLKKGLEDNKDEFIELKKNAKEMILKHGLSSLTQEELEGDIAEIDRDYSVAKKRFDAEQGLAKTRSPRPSSYHKIYGRNAATPRR